jgi:hypothetical protein
MGRMLKFVLIRNGENIDPLPAKIGNPAIFKATPVIPVDACLRGHDDPAGMTSENRGFSRLA